MEELHLLYPEAKKRGVTEMMINHPTFMPIGCSDEDIRQLAALGVYMEHEAGMFTREDEPPYGSADLKRLIDVAGVDRTIICSDLGLRGAPPGCWLPHHRRSACSSCSTARPTSAR